MKRSDALAPLSRDHQHALDVALRLRRADDRTAAAASERFLAFFDAEGRHHFEIEERLLLPALPESRADWADAVARVRDDHQAIRATADELKVARDRPVATVRALGERLNAHVRFEERVLFEMLERYLDPTELANLGAEVAAAEAER